MRRSLRGLAVLALLLAEAVGAADGDFRFAGPLPARNFQPIQLIFLNLPFERAATVGDGGVSLQVSSAESNEIATTQGRIDSVLKFETNRTVIAARYGLAPHWEVGIDLPFIARFGGFLDPIIDEVEHVFGVGNVERDMFPNNTFGEFLVRRDDGVVLFHGRDQGPELGDFSLSMKRDFTLGDRWPVVALRGAIKLPTGRAGGEFGSGRPDFGLGVAADYRALRRLMLYLNLSLVYPVGPITPADLTLDPIFTQSFAAELALFECLSATLHEALYTSPFHGTDTRLLDGTPVEIGLGLNYTWSERLAFQVMAIDNVSPVEPAADFTLLVALTGRR